MSFEEFLAERNIDAANFKVKEPLVFGQWAEIFEQSGSVSFYQQKRFKINAVRKEFPLKRYSKT